MLELVVAAALSDVLRDRLRTVLMYGSAATGDVIHSVSDMDLAVFMSGRLTAGDAVALQRALGSLDRTPYGYLQLGHCIDVRSAQPQHLFVPGATRVVSGPDVEPGWYHTELSLVAASQRFVRETSLDYLARDRGGWAMAGEADRARQLRYTLTTLKPAVRSTLVALGEPAIETWSAPYPQLIEKLRRYNAADADELEGLLARLPVTGWELQSVGDRLLCLVELILALGRTQARRRAAS